MALAFSPLKTVVNKDVGARALYWPQLASERNFSTFSDEEHKACRDQTGRTEDLIESQYSGLLVRFS